MAWLGLAFGFDNVFNWLVATLGIWLCLAFGLVWLGMASHCLVFGLAFGLGWTRFA